MSEDETSRQFFKDFSLWKRVKNKKIPLSIELEITARCNLNCRHCYINLPADNSSAKAAELSLAELKALIDKAAALGALWALITGGEPLLRKDFTEIYLYLKKKGFLINLYTNAALLGKDHIDIFEKYPPRKIEVTVYGVTEGIYEKITRTPGSFKKFLRGLSLLEQSGINFGLKAMALRTNLKEFDAIIKFCRDRSRNPIRFDPFLHLRYDGNEERNEEIKKERLKPGEISELEKGDKERTLKLKNECSRLIIPERESNVDIRLFGCGAGQKSCAISYDGLLRLCSPLWHPDCVYDLKKGSFEDAWFNFVPGIQSKISRRKEFVNKCGSCPLINLCLWCPGHAYLETGDMDKPVDYFCRSAEERFKIIKKI